LVGWTSPSIIPWRRQSRMQRGAALS